MKWSAVAALLVIAVAAARGYWGRRSSDDLTYSNLGFYVYNLTCNDAGTYCQKCYIAHSEWNVAHMHVYEVTKDPDMYKFRVIEGNQDWVISIRQEELALPLRVCSAWTNYTMDAQLARIDMCLDNNFQGVEIPPECPQPVLVQSLRYYVADKRIRGEQNLLCAAP